MSDGVAAEEVGGGRFTAAGRRAALNAALPLLVTYFADAATWDLEVTPQLGTSTDPALDDLAAAARLRASLAAADRLLAILSGVAAFPTFRYTQVSSESVGTIRGRLDLARYSRQQGRVSVPRRYPIRLVERETATPENVLAAYAAMWIRRDLAATPTGLVPPRGPEAREMKRLDYALKRIVGLPALAGATDPATAVWRRSTLPDLLDRVRQRLQAGRIVRPKPYHDLVDWIDATRQGQPVAEVGDQAWSFYDDRFDTKLFEIWCLQHLAQAITALIGEPIHTPRTLADRSKGPMYGWHIGAGTLSLHFQPPLKALGSEGIRWSYQSGGDLRGFPDLAITTNTIAGRRLALFDPKLRRRRGAPTEEIYKLLGYFGNLRYEAPAHGAILYYSPGHATDFALTSTDDGEIHAVGLDPESDDQASFLVAAKVALRAADLGSRALALLGTPTQGDETAQAERAVEIRQAVAVEALQRASAALPPATLAPTRKHTAMTLRAIWDSLGEETKTMIVTAEYFASAAPDNADHSGPLLGLAAAFERVLHEKIFVPAAALSPGAIAPGQTLGSYLRTLDNAVRGRLGDAEARAVARKINSTSGINRSLLRALIGDAKSMNRQYRIPAAHADVVSAATWADGRDALIDPRRGLLPRLIGALGL
ncbi:hypothetical protein [Rhodococcus sp. 105337]|uniref:hypothetical protein n=1 Tax=Rhodococcus sp. 105337 TaxID=2725310 RepID=UPI00146DB0A9|nr:hypothetical protein [Rhodococcus sp. 105337]NME81509.1 hypothetical protein [Rhodococcus sp. 105337]